MLKTIVSILAVLGVGLATGLLVGVAVPLLPAVSAALLTVFSSITVAAVSIAAIAAISVFVATLALRAIYELAMAFTPLVNLFKNLKTYAVLIASAFVLSIVALIVVATVPAIPAFLTGFAVLSTLSVGALAGLAAVATFAAFIGLTVIPGGILVAASKIEEFYNKHFGYEFLQAQGVQAGKAQENGCYIGENPKLNAFKAIVRRYFSGSDDADPDDAPVLEDNLAASDNYQPQYPA